MGTFVIPEVLKKYFKQSVNIDLKCLDVRKNFGLHWKLRESGISNTKVLSAIEKTPREIFIPENFRNQAYENIALPIGDETDN